MEIIRVHPVWSLIHSPGRNHFLFMVFDAVTFSRCGCFRLTAQKIWEVTGTNGPLSFMLSGCDTQRWWGHSNPNCHWRIQGGRQGRAPPGVQILSFSYSFLAKKLKNNSIFRNWCIPAGKILDPPLTAVIEFA